MAKSKSKRGTVKQKRKSLTEMKQELIAREYERPLIVDKEEFARRLDQSILHRFGEGMNLLDEVKGVLAKAATKTHNTAEKRTLNLAIEKVETSIIAFEYGSLKYNAPLRKERMILWPVEQPKKTKRRIK